MRLERDRTFETTISALPYKNCLKINDDVTIYLTNRPPNRFHRLMARLLLGWKYEEVE